MKKLLLILVLLVSGYAIGQTITDNQRHLTVRRLGGNAAITHHVFQPGLSGITYQNGYHDLSEDDTYMRITNTGLLDGNELRIGSTDYSTTNAYVESLTRTFLDANHEGGFIGVREVRQDRAFNGLYFRLPATREGWPMEFTHGSLSESIATTTYLQYNCNVNDASDCLERTVTVNRLTLTNVWGLPNSDGLLNDHTTNFNTLDEAIAHVSSNSYPSRIVIGQRFTWEAGVDNAVVATGSEWISGVVTARYSPAASWFSELESSTGHHGGYQNDYFQWTWGAAVITYSSANGGRWTWNGNTYTSQNAVFQALND